MIDTKAGRHEDFDHVFGPESVNQDLLNAVAIPIIRHVFDGKRDRSPVNANLCHEAQGVGGDTVFLGGLR
jgi:hypothetical protein